MSSAFRNHLSLDRIPIPFRKPLRIGFLAAVVVAVITLFLPNQYKSEARILPADSRGGAGAIGQMAAAAAAVGVAIPGQESSDAAFVDIVNSRWMAKTLLMENYEFRTQVWYFGGLREHRETLYTYLKVRNLDRAFRKMNGLLSVKRDLKTKLLTISAETPSSELSQQIVRKAVDILENFIQVKARTRGGNKATFTAERMKEAQTASNLAEQDFQDFLNIHRNYATSNEPAVRLKGSRLEAVLRLRQQVVATLTLNYEQALLEEKNDMPILNILDEGNLPIEKSRPARSMIVLLAFFLTSIGTWVWLNREWIRERLFNSIDDQGINPSPVSKEHVDLASR